MASLNAMRGPVTPSDTRRHERKVNRWRGNERPTDSDRALWLMIMLASPNKFESPVRLALHHGRRENTYRIQTRLLPQDGSWNRQQRIVRITRSANSVAIVVAGAPHGLNNERVETPVRIREMFDRSIQFRF